MSCETISGGSAVKTYSDLGLGLNSGIQGTYGSCQILINVPSSVV